ncbi:uncharacterized protein RSE6_12638 [Rhynchosporium secalis]|uniref:Uncharacterized protein n=1 Tax=Rhynchosporium secalis TaxID=38038 RepID=A0A1E1MQZ0_RHYSE|nr:uncharacterized protein RSE6_12638 [Rhynchosporium secalis]
MENHSRKLEEFKLARSRRPNEAAMFVENKVAPAYPQPSPVYSGQRDGFISLEEARRLQLMKHESHPILYPSQVNITNSAELWKRADAETDKLFVLMQEVQLKLSKRSKGTSNAFVSLDLKACNWEEVISEIRTTSQSWKELPRMSKGRKCLERLGQDSGAFQDWLGILPAGDYGASICGVFKLAVGAAGRFVEIEDSIFDALTELPENMEGARNYINIYRDSPNQSLERRTFDLYLAILVSLNHIMQFFADSSARKFFEPILKQQNYKISLTKSLEDVRKHVARIKDAAEQCLAGQVVDIGNNVIGIRQLADTTVERIGEMVHQQLYRLYQNGILVNNNAHGRSFRQIYSISQLTDMVVRENPSEATPNSFIVGRAQHLLTPAPYDATPAEDLLELLRFDTLLISESLKRCLESGDKLDDQGKARALAMVNSDKMRVWIAEANFSSSLLVNGRSDMGAIEGPSPLSFVDAQLVKVFESHKEALVISYFSRFHRNIEFTTPGTPTARLMVCLISGLLTEMMARKLEVDVLFLKSEKRKLQDLDLTTLCNAFRDLTMQLPAGTILVCILDEIVSYESFNPKSEIDAIMRRLTRLVTKHTDLIFKLLVTSRGRSMNLQQYFDDEDILDLPKDIELNDSAMWKIRHMGEQKVLEGTTG